MTILYCFCNVSLTERILNYLARKLRRYVHYVTVIFLNDFWLIRLKLRPNVNLEDVENCQSVFEENGIPYQNHGWIQQVLNELDAGCDPIAVMNYHRVTIVSHGDPQVEEVEHFKEKFVSGLGYCPPSLV